MYTIIHETIHAERLFNEKFLDDTIMEEREVQELAYKRYKAIYGKEPPFHFKEKDELKQEMIARGFDSLSKEYTALSNSTDPKDQQRFHDVINQLTELSYELMRGVPNRDYDKDRDKIDRC